MTMVMPDGMLGDTVGMHTLCATHIYGEAIPETWL